MKIYRMCDAQRDIRQEVAAVFVDGYGDDLSTLSKDKQKLISMIQHAFVPDVFYVAERDETIIGILACTTGDKRGMRFSYADVVHSLGLAKGSIAYLALHQELGKSLNIPKDTGYIEMVATAVSARRKGVSSALFAYVEAHLPFAVYTLEVTDSNIKAYQLYRKLGFEEFHRVKNKSKKQHGFSERILMRKLV